MYVKTLFFFTCPQRFQICTLEENHFEQIIYSDNPSIYLFFWGEASQKNKARQQNKSNSEERREPSMSNSDEWRQMEEAAAEASQATRDGQLFGLGNSK